MQEAVASLENVAELSGRSGAALGPQGHAYAFSGRTGDAKRILQELLTLAERAFVPSYEAALIHIGLGQNDAAFACLEQAVEERESWLVFAKVHPILDPLRRDPRFEEFLRHADLR
jgi:tetratricopeptide (TPR) repeat protein